MTMEQASGTYVERRSEPRELLNLYHSVEFCFRSPGPIYQFKLRNVSSRGLCILVKENSAVMQQLQVGDIIDMQYRTPETPTLANALKTRIRHISREGSGRYKHHFLVGLSVVEEGEQDATDGGNGGAHKK